MLSDSEIQNLKKSVSSLGTELTQQAQDAHGFFTTKTRHAVSYANPGFRQQVQGKLDHAVAILAIANLMAIFEEFVPEKYWSAIFTDIDTISRLKAYRHVRFSAIYGFTMKRATENHKEFDDIMSGSDPLKGVIRYSDSTIKLSEMATNHALQYIRQQYNKAIVTISQL